MPSSSSQPSESPAPGTGVGNDIRALRKSRGRTLAELSLAIGRSVGFLSQVERGLSDPTLEDLRALAQAFDVPIGFFFGRANVSSRESGVVVRAGARRRLGDPAGGLSEELLSPDLGGAFEIIRSEFMPGATLQTAQRRDTEEAGYVVSGCLELWIGEQHFELAPGDSFRFNREPYRWRNPGDVPCVVVWVIAPPTY